MNIGRNGSLMISDILDGMKQGSWIHLSQQSVNPDWLTYIKRNPEGHGPSPGEMVSVGMGLDSHFSGKACSLHEGCIGWGELVAFQKRPFFIVWEGSVHYDAVHYRMLASMASTQFSGPS